MVREKSFTISRGGPYARPTVKWIIISVFMLTAVLFAVNSGAEETESLDCSKYACREVITGADTFQKAEGGLNVMKALKGDTLLGYIFLSTDIVDIPGYSGKPLVTLIGIDTKGTIVVAKVVKHHEPILLVGIPEGALQKFVSQYIGVNAGDKVVLGKSGDPKVKAVDAVSGATVTVIAEDRTIMKSTRSVAESLGIIKRGAGATGHLVMEFKPMSWKELIDNGLLGHLKVTPEEAGVQGAEAGQPWVDIYFGYLNLPVVGKNLMGENNYRWVSEEISKGGHAFLVVSNGISSFKGSGFVRGGIFERFNFEQRGNSFTFRDTDYFNFYQVEAKDAPEFKEGGVFIIREKGFSPYEPFTLNFLSSQVVGSIERKFNVFKAEYRLPKSYAVVEKEAEKEEALWVPIWKSHTYSIIFLSIYLIVILILFVGRKRLVKDRILAKWTRYAVMAVSLAFVGYYTMAQPSVTQAITVTHNILRIPSGGFQWSLFLSDPIIFILWWYIGLTIILWGRGVFCGWICPYGVLTEFAYKTFHKVFPKKFKYELPYGLHKWLIYLKYGVFGFLLLVSFRSMETAERFAEIEPFKTAFLVGPLNRTWPFMLYFFALLAVCLVVYRFFCKYICPLGAGLAAPTTFSLFGVRRRDFCSKCSICARECDQRAIDEQGKVDKRECLYCLQCEENFWDNEKCPVLIKEKKEKEKGTVEE